MWKTTITSCIAKKTSRPSVAAAVFVLATFLVTGCSTAAYVADSAASVGHPTYHQTAVADITLHINDSDVHVRAPVGCRSFFHPAAGIRVTRNSGERFILPTKADRLELIEFSYSCSELDAGITLSPTVMVNYYLAKRSQSHVITKDVAVPIRHPGGKSAQVVLIEAKLDLSDTASNVVVVESIKDEMSKFFGESGQLRFASVEATYLSVPGPSVDSNDSEELLKLSEAAFVSRELQKRVAKLMPKYSLILDTDNPQFERDLERIEFTYLPNESVFVPLKRSGGHRTYFAITSDRCEKKYQFCLQDVTKARIGGHDFGFDLRMVYDPKTRGIYHFGLKWF